MTDAPTRTAVVFVHGLPHERRPFDTLGEFAAAALGPTAAVYPRPVEITDSYEARHYVSGEPAAIEVFEYDWRFHQTAGRYAGLVPMALRVLLRRPANVPTPLYGIWRAIWLVLLTPIAVAACLLILGGYFLSTGVPAWIVGLVSSALVLAIGLGAFRTVSIALTRSFVTAGFVDVARYLDPLPASYAARRAIRGGLVDLLHNLQQGRFARVVVVGHGLGAYIAYDALTALWAETHELRATTPAVPDGLAHLAALEGLARTRESNDDARAFQAVQHALWQDLRLQGNPWRVTDFVTVGTPMALADLLVARPAVLSGLRASDPADRTVLFDRAVRRGAVLTCPPRPETQAIEGPATEPSYAQPGDGPTVLGSQAPFAVTRWTNLWYPVTRGSLRGDWFGGALRPLFGAGVRDVPIPDDAAGRRRGAAHLKYFSGPESAFARELRRTLALDACEDLTRLNDAPPPDLGTVARVVHRSWQRSA
jgi:hypothetical protein